MADHKRFTEPPIFVTVRPKEGKCQIKIESKEGALAAKAARAAKVKRLKREAKAAAIFGAEAATNARECVAAGNLTAGTLYAISAAKYFEVMKSCNDLAAAYKNKTEHQRGKK